MTDKKWFAPILPYLAVWAGLFLFHGAWTALLGFHVAVLFTLLIFHPAVPIRDLFRSETPGWILASTLVCSTSGIGLYILWNYFGIAGDLPEQLRSIGLKSSTWFAFIAYFTLVNPFIEEYFWRGVLGSNVKKLYFGDFVFAGYHVIILWGRVNSFSILFAVIILVSAGWLWRQITREDKGLFAAVLGHMAADFLILLTICLRTG
jgi:membrane protease YdiL (CAAX protease family)